jgi:hypothetical protein
MFHRGCCYTRAEIHDQLGGGVQEYLPHVDGRVVCVCITLSKNPDAPAVLLVGNKPDVQRYGRVLAKQRGPLPVFVKRGSNKWEYQGDYVVTESSKSPPVIEQWAARAGREGEVTLVVFMSEDFRLPDEVPPGTVHIEGSVRRVKVNRYERDPKAREACIAHYGTVCYVCGFDFAAVYGEVMAGFTHVHHLKPPATVGDSYRVNPVQDLRPVSPNCHSVIHRREPPYSIEEVQQLLQSAGRGRIKRCSRPGRH